MTTENCCLYLQNGPVQTSQTGGQQYSDTSPFSIPQRGERDGYGRGAGGEVIHKGF
jgi:hypothetical protein